MKPQFLTKCFATTLFLLAGGAFPLLAMDPPDLEFAEDGEGVESRQEPWSGRFDLGYTWQSGRAEKNELSVRGQADRVRGPHEYRAVAEFLYGEVDSSKNTHRYGGSFRWRRSLTDRLFSQTISSYQADRIREINHRVEQNASLGYRVVRTDRVDASIAPGFTVQYTDETGLDDRWAYLASLFQDFGWEMTEQYRFEQDLHFLIDPGDTDDYIVRGNAGIVGTVRDSISLSIRYQLLYENETRPEVESTDQRVIASVGYSF